jgi:hypothetical protein
MSRYTWTVFLQLVGLFGFAILARSQELLVTSPGSYIASCGCLSTGVCLSVEVKLPDPEHIDFKIKWRIREIDNIGHTNTREWTNGFFVRPVPVARDRWAICMMGSDEFWFYDGRGAFIYHKGTSDGLGPNTCPAPNIGELAPESLKEWMSKKSRTSK